MEKNKQEAIKESKEIQGNIEKVMGLIVKYKEIMKTMHMEYGSDLDWNITRIFEDVKDRDIYKEDAMRLRRAFIESEEPIGYMKRALEIMVDDMQICLELNLEKELYEGLIATDESIHILVKYI